MGDDAWLDRLQAELRGLVAPVFAQARSRLAAFAYIRALLAEPGDRRSCWQLAEAAGHVTPRRMQALLAEHAWDWKAALKAIMVLDETAELKQGTKTVGVAPPACRDHRAGGELPDRRVRRLRRRPRPYPVRFPALPAEGLVPGQGAAPAGAGPGGGGVHHQARPGHRDDYRRGRRRGAARLGGCRRSVRPQHQAAGSLREGREGVRARGPGELPGQAPVRAQGGRVRAGPAGPASAWETRSCGRGCKGHRDYGWAWAATASRRHWVLVRRSLTDPSDLAFFYCHAPQDRPVSLPAARQRRRPATGDDPGLVKVSVPEARRLARLATAPMTRAARDLGHSWSRWRRRHQARARWHHYHAQLNAAHVT